MGINWNPLWLNPFESAWSIIEKIKYANAISSRDFVGEFGTRDSNGRLINQRNSLLKFNGVDLNLLNQSSGTNFNKHLEYYFDKMIGMFAHLDTNLLLRKQFTYCEECLSRGYHSLLHQFIFIDKCPYHLNNLTTNCNSCCKSFSCKIHNHKSKGGFQCTCSGYYIDLKFNSLSEWHLNLPIRETLIIKWVTMDSATFKRIKETYFYLPSLINMNDTLQFLLDFGKD